MRGFNLWVREKERFAKRERELHVRSEGMPLPMLAVACNGELEYFWRIKIMAMEVAVRSNIKKRLLLGRGNWLGSV